VRPREPRLPPNLEYALAGAAGADRLLVAFDFDGTLSPIVANYESAAADREAVESLFALAALPRTRVAVISGRARADLERRLGDIPRDVILVGCHGAELDREAGSPDEKADADPDTGSDSGPSAQVGRFSELLAPVALRYPGARLERKPLSLAFHYRNVGEVQQSAAREEAIEAAGPSAVAVKDGKKVVEFLVVQADKGTALRQLRALEGSGSSELTTLFVGDDVTDEAAFEALTGRDIGVKVGSGPTAAGFEVDGQEYVAPMLQRLLRLRSEKTGKLQ
jgi:trehalose 6-phosphate phosphatase